MCWARLRRESSAPPWEPVIWKRGWARSMRPQGQGGAEDRSLRVRILCGSYDPASPFIEGGCAHDWIEFWEEPDCATSCPNCGRTCQEELVQCARVMLQTRVVFVLGCPHQSFTFSRRRKEPYFSPEPEPDGRQA
jgi:hypothetical protein